MAFRLSKRSMKNLAGIDPKLTECVQAAIKTTRVDFGVIEGMRTIERQRELVKAGASKTLNSMHIIGKAFDVMAYVGRRASWETSLYDDIADAIRFGAMEVNVPIRWGAAWHIPDIRMWDGSMQDAMDSYVALRRSQGRRAFIDAGHFETNEH